MNRVLKFNFTGNEDSISLGSSLVSLAERGSVTPARQRTVTEVIWPEQMAALNSGLRSRLSSSTSLFRAGSQRSVAVDCERNYPLGRQDSQRSILEMAMKPLYLSESTPNQPEMELPNAAMSSGATGGWRSEQGSPRRPASLLFSDSNPDRDWSTKSIHATSLRGGDGTPVGAASPTTHHKRFSTTNVELLPEQVLDVCF